MEIVLSQKVYYNTDNVVKKGKSKNKGYKLSTSLGVVKTWMKNNMNLEVYRFFRSMLYRYPDNSDYYWLVLIFQNILFNMMDIPYNTTGYAEKYKIFVEIFNDNEKIDKLEGDFIQKYVYFLIFRVTRDQCFNVIETLTGERHMKFFASNKIYQADYLMLCIDVCYLTQLTVNDQLMKYIKTALYGNKELSSPSISWKTITDYSDRKNQLRLKYHMLRAYNLIKIKELDDFMNEVVYIENLTGSELYTNFLMVFFHFLYGNLNECLSIIRKLKRQPLKIPGRSELYFAKQYLVNIEVVVLALQNKYNYATIVYENMFEDKNIIYKSIKIVGPCSKMLAVIIHNGAILSLINGKFLRACHLLVKSTVILQSDNQILLFFAAMCHFCENYRITSLKDDIRSSTNKKRLIINIFMYQGFYAHFMAPCYSSAFPNLYLLNYQNACTYCEVINYQFCELSSEQTTSKLMFFVLYGVSLLKARHYEKCIQILEPLTNINTDLPYLIHYLIIVWLSEAYLNMKQYEKSLSTLKILYFREMEFQSLPIAFFSEKIHYLTCPLPSCKDDAIMNLEFNILVVNCASKCTHGLSKLYKQFKTKYGKVFCSTRLRSIKAIIKQLMAKK